MAHMPRSRDYAFLRMDHQMRRNLTDKEGKSTQSKKQY